MIQRNERNQETQETQRCSMCPMLQMPQMPQKILTDETDQTKYLFEEVDIEDVVNDAIDETFVYLNAQAGQAVTVALTAKNPVDGYQKATDLIDDAFDDIEAPVITSMIRNKLMQIMKHRVDALMEGREN